jgi:hypothetical protein
MKSEEDVHDVLVDKIIEEVFVSQTENTFFMLVVFQICMVDLFSSDWRILDCII